MEQNENENGNQNENQNFTSINAVVIKNIQYTQRDLDCAEHWPTIDEFFNNKYPGTTIHHFPVLVSDTYNADRAWDALFGQGMLKFVYLFFDVDTVPVNFVLYSLEALAKKYGAEYGDELKDTIYNHTYLIDERHPTRPIGKIGFDCFRDESWDKYFKAGDTIKTASLNNIAPVIASSSVAEIENELDRLNEEVSYLFNFIDAQIKEINKTQIEYNKMNIDALQNLFTEVSKVQLKQNNVLKAFDKQLKRQSWVRHG